MTKKTYLVNVAYLIDLTEEEYQEIGDKLIGSVENELALNKNHKLEWESSSTILLDPVTMNCGRCFNCSCWVTDREKPNPIDELNNGAIVEGRLLCDECLPENHRWAF
ncbi:hypothetical protein [Paenibacillus wenxiniae]|uniref:4Fe-4S ferredoxin-type domain-containing protein n=1 Tax=Paenibacillus wenxiniae TaxID=1636843 RepID=A0ABW4RIC9_9BACL